MTQLLQLQRTEVLKLNSSSYKIQTLDFCDHGRCSTLPTELSPRGGGYSGFQVTGMIEQSQKSKPKKSQGLQTNPAKIPGPKFNPRKIPCRISEPSVFFLITDYVSRGNYHESSDCFEYPLNQAP